MLIIQWSKSNSGWCVTDGAKYGMGLFGKVVTVVCSGWVRGDGSCRWMRRYTIVEFVNHHEASCRRRGEQL